MYLKTLAICNLITNLDLKNFVFISFFLAKLLTAFEGQDGGFVVEHSTRPAYPRSRMTLFFVLLFKK